MRAGAERGGAWVPGGSGRQGALLRPGPAPPPTHIHDFALGAEMGHQHVLAVGHPGERDAEPARHQLVDVVREVLVQLSPEVAAHVKGRVQDAQLPAAGHACHFHDHANHTVCGGRRAGLRRVGWYCQAWTDHLQACADPKFSEGRTGGHIPTRGRRGHWAFKAVP